MDTPSTSSETHPTETKSPDIDDILHMLKADMDFEQAYAMYTTLQPEQAMSSVEQLEKVQSLNQQYVASLQGEAFQNTIFKPDYSYDRAQITHNYSFHAPKKDDFDQFFSNSESIQLEAFLDDLTSTTGMGLYKKEKREFPGSELNDMFDLYTMQTFTREEKSHVSGHVTHVPHDHRHSVASPMNASTNASMNASMNASTSMNTSTSLNSSMNSSMNISSSLNSPLLNPAHGRTNADHESLKKELTEAFSYPHLKSFGRDGMSRASSCELDEPKKRRRSSAKPLLSLEQKRLNHSNSEQRRRQMCKLAYERCLRLIVDIDAFNRLPPESPEAQRKTKRARVNKDGLPNLSKHSALMRISNEIVTIREKNEKLRKLLGLPIERSEVGRSK